MERNNRLPISKVRVWNAFKKVYSNRGSWGVDGVTWEVFRSDLENNLYRLWNRMSSGSYFPQGVRAVEIPKKDGGVRKLGIPTIVDRIAQQVATDYLQPLVDPHFHEHSYGYRPNKNAHQALDRCIYNTQYYSWVVDVDIKGFFDNIPHKYILKGVEQFCGEKWVLLYIKRWLEMPVGDQKVKRKTGTPQGGVISPLLANIFLHFGFDRWMDKLANGSVEFERYADDIVIHCRSERQALMFQRRLSERMNNLGLELHPKKTKIVNTEERSLRDKRYPKSFDFLGYTMKPMYIKTRNREGVMYNWVISKSSRKGIMSEVRRLKLYKWRGSIQELAKVLNPKLRGWIAYYSRYSKWLFFNFLRKVNKVLIKWLKWNKKLHLGASIRWLKNAHKHHRTLFEHWKYMGSI